jgi:Glycosyl transferases group 1
VEYLERAFVRHGIEVKHVYADENTRFDRFIIRRINKFAHSLRFLPKTRNLFEQHPWAHRNFRSENLIRAYTEFSPDLVFLVRGLNFRVDILKRISPLFGWWVEHEGRIGEALAEIGNFDGYFFMNESCVGAAQDAGFANASYLAHAVDLQVFYPLPGSEKKYDICFVGNWSAKRQLFIEAALKVSPNLALYGGKWLGKCWNKPPIIRCWKGRYVEGEDLNRLYNVSRVVLNVTNWGKGQGKARSGMNMRVLEVPATGTFLLTDESKELDSFLKPGVHVGIYNDLEDFPVMLRQFLKNDMKRETIAAAGLAHVRERHTYDHVVRDVINRYRDWVKI